MSGFLPEREDADVVVLGGGPAGLAAARSARESGARVLLVEREERLGGVLKQCVHEGFGLERFGERLTGPEYALREAAALGAVAPTAPGAVAPTAPGAVAPTAPGAVGTMTGSFVVAAEREGRGFLLRCLSRGRAFELRCAALVLATGCRERTDRQVFVHGDRPAGILTAGLAQYMVNVQGLLPGARAVILGSGDIGLIMARRLVLEGAEVEGVYEIKAEPSGLSRNLRQCLDDFGIPLRLSSTVTAVRGKGRVVSVETAAVDQRGAPLAGTARSVPCDCLILSVGLIPENEIALSLGAALDPATRGPRVDQSGSCLEPGLFSCGNALHVSDLADYASESGDSAGRAAAELALRGAGYGAGRGGADSPARELVPLKAGPGFLYAVPQFLDLSRPGKAIVSFRSNAILKDGARAILRADGREIASRSYRALRPPEMERLEIEVGSVPRGVASLQLELERKGWPQ